MARELNPANQVVLDSAADEAYVDGDEVLDFVEFDAEPDCTELTAIAYDSEVKQLRQDLLAAAEQLEFEASVLRRQYELLAQSERRQWYH